MDVINRLEIKIQKCNDDVVPEVETYLELKLASELDFIGYMYLI
ncbi:13726_t:CDS:1, partial [Gigaspora margarita]